MADVVHSSLTFYYQAIVPEAHWAFARLHMKVRFYAPKPLITTPSRPKQQHPAFPPSP